MLKSACLRWFSRHCVNCHISATPVNLGVLADPIPPAPTGGVGCLYVVETWDGGHWRHSLRASRDTLHAGGAESVDGRPGGGRSTTDGFHETTLSQCPQRPLDRPGRQP